MFQSVLASKATSGLVLQLEQALKETPTQTNKRDEYDNLSKRPPGRRPDSEKRIAEAAENERLAEAARDSAGKRQEAALRARREIGRCYHPYDPENGEAQRPERVSELLLEPKFETIYEAISGLSQRAVKHIDKAHRVAKDMVATVAFFFAMIEQYMMNTDLNEHEFAIMKDFLIPGFYQRRVAGNEKDADHRDAIFKKYEELS